MGGIYMRKEKIDINKLIEEAKAKGLVRTYEEFCDSPESDLYCISEEEAKYYNSLGESKCSIGDIVYVLKYSYKNGLIGKEHLFVIVADNTAIDINFFGFLISSNIDKIKYNVLLKSNYINNLNRDSIVKCDDLIIINDNDIIKKIGKVSKKEFNNFISLYNDYCSVKVNN